MNKNKFRIWDKKYKAWADPHCWRLNAQGEIVWNRLLNSPNGQEDFVIQQFTGLVDKNGKEIWEGDFVKLPSFMVGGLEKIKQGEHNWLIVWGDCGFSRVLATSTRSLSKDDPDAFTEIKQICVVGNVFENPELLTK